MPQAPSPKITMAVRQPNASMVRATKGTNSPPIATPLTTMPVTREIFCRNQYPHHSDGHNTDAGAQTGGNQHKCGIKHG